MSRLNKSRLLVAAASAVVIPLSFSSIASAQVVWDGGGANDNLTTPANWVGDVLPSTTSRVDFTGLVRTSPIADVNVQYASLFFVAGATTPFTINGPGTITLGSTTAGNYLNNDAVGIGHIFNAPVTMIGGTVNATQGNLTFNGTLNIGNGGTATGNTVTLAAPVNRTIAVTTLAGAGTAATGGAITKTGAGLLTVSGANAAWLGNVNVNGGIVRISNADALGAGTSTIAMSAGTAGGGTGSGTLELTNDITLAKATLIRGRADNTVAHINNFSGNNTINTVTGTSGGGFHNFQSAAGLLTINNYVIDSAVGSARTITFGGAGNGQINAWAPSNATLQHILQKNGAGTWTLGSGMASTGKFGAITVNGGNLVLKGGLGAISAGNTVINNGGTLTVESDGANNGEVGNGTTATTITVASGGTLDASTFTSYSMQVAQTLIAGGTIKAGAFNTFGDNVVRIGNVATAAAGTMSVVGNLNISNEFSSTTGGYYFDLTSAATTVGGGVNDLVSITGDLSVNTAGGAIPLRINSLGGGFANGTYRLFEFTSGTTLSPSLFTLVGAGSSRQLFSVDTAPGQVNLLVTGNPASLVWAGDGGGNVWDVNGTSNWRNGANPDKFFQFDNVTFNDTSANKTVNLSTTVTPTSVLVDTASTYTINGAGNISGSSSLTKSGTGTLVLANTLANDFTGAITINAGTLQVGIGGAEGSLPTVAIANNGSLVYNISGTATPGIISGTGSLVKRGTGTLVLNVAHTYSGSTTIEAGTVFTGNANAFGDTTGATTVLSGASVYLLGPASTIPENLTIAGDGVAAGNGVLRSGGSVATTLTGNIVLSAASTLNNDGGSSIIINGGTVSGVGPITKLGNGTTLLAGTTHSWTGGLTINGGTFQLGTGTTAGALPAGAVTLTAGTLAFGSNATATVSNDISGAGTISALSTGGTTTLTGNLSGFTGVLQAAPGGDPLLPGTLIVATPTNATVARVADNNGTSNQLGLGYGVLRLANSAAIPAAATIDIQVAQVAGRGRLELSGGIDVVAASTSIAQRHLTGNPAVLTLATANTLTPAIRSVDGTNSFNSPITLTTGGVFAGIDVSAGSSLEVKNTIKPLSTAGSPRNLVLSGDGSGVVSGAISNDTQALNVWKTGTGTWRLSGANSYGPNGSGAGGITYLLGGTLRVAEVAQAPILSSTGGIDIQAGKLVLEHGPSSAVPTQVGTILDAGYDLASRFSTGQIRASVLPANLVLGWTDNGSLTTVTATLEGDFNLDYTVNFDDLLKLAANYNQLSGKTWGDGDVNYDGAVNFDDLLKLAANYNQSVTAGGFAGDWALAQSLVPEPTSLAAIAVGASALLSRRRRATR
jgi:fibronectin-binding autotransporter adhesin